MRLYGPPILSNSWWVPLSTMLPPARIRILSAFTIVDRVLWHDGEAMPETGDRNLGNGSTIQKYTAALRLAEPHQEPDERGLSRSTRSNDGNRSASADLKAHILQNGSPRFIRKADILELQFLWGTCVTKDKQNSEQAVAVAWLD